MHAALTCYIEIHQGITSTKVKMVCNVDTPCFGISLLFSGNAERRLQILKYYSSRKRFIYKESSCTNAAENAEKSRRRKKAALAQKKINVIFKVNQK